MKTRLYTCRGRFVTEISISGNPEAVIWDDRAFLRDDDQSFVETALLPPEVRNVYVAHDRDSAAQAKEWGESQIGRENNNW